MSHTGNLDVTDDETKTEESCCSHYSWQSICLMVSNSIYWLFSIGYISLSAWCAAGTTASFVAGTSVFTYSFLSVSFLSFVMCIMGFLALIYQHKNLALSYVVMFVCLIVIQTGLLLGCHFRYGTTGVQDMIEQVWSESNSFIVEETSRNLECCGFTTWNDTYSTVIDIPVGCADPDTKFVHNKGCGELIEEYFRSAAVYPYFVTLMILPAVFEILAFVTGCLYYHLLKTSDVSEEKEGRRSQNRNKIVPIMISPLRGDRALSTPAPKGTKSAASGQDVDLNVDTPTTVKNKGNEVLFRVADAMLEA